MRCQSLVAVLALFFGLPAWGDPITYTTSFVASGTLGGSPFMDQSVRLIASGDTSTVQTLDLYHENFSNAVTLQVIVGGEAPVFGTAPSYTVTSVYKVQAFTISAGNSAQFITFSCCEGYALASNFTGTGSGVAYGQHFGMPLETTGGELLFATDNVGGSTVVGSLGIASTPETSSLALLGTGLLGVVGTMRRRRA